MEPEVAADAGGISAPPGGNPAGGMFDGLRIDDPGEKEPVALPPLDPDPVTSGPVGSDAGKKDPSKAEGEEDKKEPRLYAGRYKTDAELERAYEESSREGLRLYRESRAMRADLEDRDTLIADLKKQIATAQKVPVLKELSAEEMQVLKKEDPGAYAEYIADKKLNDYRRDQEERQSKEVAEKDRQTRRETASFIRKRMEEMQSDAKRWPDYAKLEPLMEDILDKTEDILAGHRWTPEFLYYAAAGYRHIAAARAGSEKSKVSEDEAKKKAEAAARAGGSSVGGRTPTPPDVAKDDGSDAAFTSRLLKAGPKSFFKF